MRTTVVEPRYAVFDAFSAIAATYCAVFAWVFFGVGDSLILGYVHLVSLVFVLGNWIVARSKKDFDTGINIILAVGTTVVSALFATGGWEGSGYIWTFGYLPYAALLTTRKRAIFWMATLLAANAMFVGADIAGVIDVPYTGIQLLNYFFDYLIFSACIVLYQTSLEKYRTLAEKRLVLVQHYSKRLEILIDQMPVGVIIVEGGKGFLTMTNEAAFRMLGRKIDPSVGAVNFMEAYHIEREDGSPYPSAESPLSVTLQSGIQSLRSDMFIRQVDGSRIALRMACVPIQDEQGKTNAVVVVLEDMTKEYETDRQKTEFISIASHELRAPLTGIKWNTDLLLDKSEGVLNQDQFVYATHIKEINDKLVTLVNDLLNVSRLEAGTIGSAPTKVDLTTLIDTVLKDLAGLYQAKKQKLVYASRPLPEINIDPRLVTQVFTNLLSNAVKYTPEGGTINVTVETRVDDLRVAVTDTGMGIPKSQQSQMFKKFFRAENASSSKIEGTGLGLYISKRAIELAGGELGFESEENRGATFWFTLPLVGGPKTGTKALS